MVSKTKPRVVVRSYRQFCGAAKALDVVGARWVLLVVRNLLLGPQRFADLNSQLPGIPKNLLSARLKELSAAGVVTQVGDRYALTPAGLELEPVVVELGRWGARFLGQPERGDVVNPAWGVISLKRRYKGGERLQVELEIAEPTARAFELQLTPEKLICLERAASAPELRLAFRPGAFRQLFFAGTSHRVLEKRGALRVTGRPEVWARFRRAMKLDAA